MEGWRRHCATYVCVIIIGCEGGAGECLNQKVEEVVEGGVGRAGRGGVEPRAGPSP